MPISAHPANRSPTRGAPSSIEDSECTCRWTKELCEPSAMSGAQPPGLTHRYPLRGAGALGARGNLTRADGRVRTARAGGKANRWTSLSLDPLMILVGVVGAGEGLVRRE